MENKKKWHSNLLSKKSTLQEKLIFIKRREQGEGKTNSVWTIWII